jgi:hypothetical protein
MNIRRPLKHLASFLLLVSVLNAEPVLVRHVQGYVHGFIVLKDLDDRILATGDVTQTPTGTRVTSVLTLRFRNGSLHQETAVFSQRRVFQLLSYKQVQKGPTFKSPTTFSFETSTGKVHVQYTDRDGQVKTIEDHLSLPADLANGMVSTLLTDIDPKVETTLSMLVSTPKPRVVKLKIAASEQDPFSVGGVAGKAMHYVIKIDIGGVTGVVAKAVGKQPPPIHTWVAAGNAPAFLRSEGPLFEGGLIYRIELASPVWPKTAPK